MRQIEIVHKAGVGNEAPIRIDEEHLVDVTEKYSNLADYYSDAPQIERFAGGMPDPLHARSFYLDSRYDWVIGEYQGCQILIPLKKP